MCQYKLLQMCELPYAHLLSPILTNTYQESGMQLFPPEVRAAHSALHDPQIFPQNQQRNDIPSFYSVTDVTGYLSYSVHYK